MGPVESTEVVLTPATWFSYFIWPALDEPVVFKSYVLLVVLYVITPMMAFKAFKLLETIVTGTSDAAQVRMAKIHCFLPTIGMLLLIFYS